MDKCYFCQTGDLEEKTVDYSFSWGQSLVVIKGVPALVCTNCGEKYFRPEISAMMKRMAKEVIEGKRRFEKMTVPAIEYEEAAA